MGKKKIVKFDRKKGIYKMNRRYNVHLGGIK